MSKNQLLFVYDTMRLIQRKCNIAICSSKQASEAFYLGVSEVIRALLLLKHFSYYHQNATNTIAINTKYKVHLIIVCGFSQYS